VHRRICPAVKVEGGERERGSEDRRWRKVGEDTFIWCGEVIVTLQRIGAGLLGQHEWGLQGRFGCPPQIGGL